MLKDSIDELEVAIKQANVMLPGGFSVGDAPEGSVNLLPQY
ncbi:MAG: hypothetical protein ACLRQF_24830 [Thomasclavelia ramosa]